MGPVKRRTRIGFPARRDITMAGEPFEGYGRPGSHDAHGHLRKCIVLGRRVGLIIGTFQLDTDREIITLRTTVENRASRMPGPLKQTDKLNAMTIPPDQNVGGNPHVRNRFKIGMVVRVQSVTEKLFYGRASVLAGRQAYVVHHQQ